MNSLVRKSSLGVIQPETQVINLSIFDKGLETLPVTMFLVFDHPIHEPAETIKRALSQALVHYYPIAGRLALGSNDGKLCIQCAGQGVTFLAASANCTLEESHFFDASSPVSTTLLEELVIDYPDEGCSRSDPLLLMQVTEFSCGGFVVGVTWNHAISDGFGMAQFLQAVGELTSGLRAPSVVPVRYDASLPELPPSDASQRIFMTSQGPQNYVLLDTTIPWSLIDHIKDKFGSHSGGQPCSTSEAVTAMLWQCRTRATISDPEASAMLFFVADARKSVGAKDGYYGNCSSDHMAMATCGSVASGDIVDIVKMIKHAKEQGPDKLLKEEDGGGSLGEEHGNGVMLRDNYNLLGVSSMCDHGLDGIDFGGGGPARVMCRVPPLPIPVCTSCVPWKANDGANVVSRCVKEEHAGAFLAELSRFTV